MSRLIRAEEIRIIEPVYRGVGSLKQSIVKNNQVFCICAIGRDYHVGANDAEETLQRAVKRGFLEKKKSPTGNREDIIFSPRHSSFANPKELNIMEESRRAEVKRVYRILEKTYGRRFDKPRLLEIGKDVHDSYLGAFYRLLDFQILPVTAGNSAFNHQGMLLLMEQVFIGVEGSLMTYLRDPKSLQKSEVETLMKRKRGMLNGRTDRRRVFHLGEGSDGSQPLKPNIMSSISKLTNVAFLLTAAILLAAFTGVSTTFYWPLTGILGGLGAGLILANEAHSPRENSFTRVALYAASLFLIYEAIVLISELSQAG